MKLKRKTLFASIISAFALSAAVLTGAVFGNGKTTTVHAAASGSASIFNIDTKTGTANTNFENVITGAQSEYVYFGMDGGSPIAWRVLAKNDDKYGSGKNLLLLKDTGFIEYYMDPSNTTDASAYWGTSSIRAKLNGNDPSGNSIEYYGWDPSKTARGFMSYSLETSYAGKYFKVGSDTSQLDAIKAISADKPLITRLGFWESGNKWSNNVPYYNIYFANTKTLTDAMTVDIYNVNGSAKYLCGDNDVKCGNANVIGEKTSGERLFLLDYEDFNNRNFGFVDSTNGLTYLEQCLNTLPGYNRTSWVNGDLSIAASSLAFTDALKCPYSENYYMRTPALWQDGSLWKVGGVGAVYGGQAVNNSSNACGINVMTNAANNMSVLPATVFDTTKIVYANGSTGYITGNNFTNVQSPVIANSSGKDEYKLYIKDTNYDSTGFTPYVTSANNKLKVTFSNTSGKAGNIVVLLQDKTATDGSIAYQAVASMTATTSTQTAEFNLPAGITYKDYQPIVMLTSSKTSATAQKATENVYATYTQDGIIVPEDISGMEYSASISHWLDNLNLKTGENTPAWIDASTHLDSTIVNVKEIKFTSYAEDAVETTVNNADTTKIKDAGVYTITLEIVDKANYFWQGGGTDDKSFKITIGKTDIVTFTPTVPSGTYYAGVTTEDEDGFPAISPPNAWSGKGTLEWDSGQTLSTTGDYNWTFTPDEEVNTADYADSAYKVSNYNVKKGSSPITVTQIAVGSISAELTGTADIFTSTKLEDLLKRITVTKTNNNGTDGGTADVSEVQFKAGTKLEAGTDKKLTIQLVADTTISCEVEIPEILEVVPVELDVKLADNAGTIYTSISVDDLKAKLIVKIKNNDGTTGKTLTASEFKFAEDFELNDGAYTLNVYKADDEDINGTIQLTVDTAAVKSVELKPIVIPEGVTIWEGAAPDTLKQYLTVEVTYLDGKDTKATLSATDNYFVSVVGDKEALPAGQCGIFVTYGGVKSGTKTLTVTAVVVTNLTPTYIQMGKTIYSSAKLEDLELDTYLSVDAEFNDETSSTLDPSEYTVTLPKDFSSTNNKVTVTWKKGNTTITETFEVDVTDVVPESISASYTVPAGKTLDATNKPDDLKAGLTVTLTNNDGSTKTLTETEYTLEAAESDTHNSGCLCAGNLTITVKFGEDEDINKTFSVTVDKADVDMSGVEFKDDMKRNDGGSYTLEITGTLPTVPAGITVSYSVEGQSGTSFSATGVYKFTAEFAHNDSNYKAIPDMKAKLTISDKNVYDISGLSFGATGATGTNGVFTATYAPDTTVAITLDGKLKKDAADGGAEVDAQSSYKYEKKNASGGWEEVDASALKNAGEYKVTVTLTTGDSDYEDNIEKVATLTIEKADPDTDGFSFEDVTVTFNDAAHEFGIVGVTPDYIEVEYTYDGETQSDPFSFTEEGTYPVTVHFIVKDTENYNGLDDITKTLTIEAKPVHDMGGVEIKPTSGENGSGLKPDDNGGYTGKYGEGGGFEIGVQPEDLPDGVTIEETIIKKKNPDGTWTEVPEVDGAGDYEVTVKFDGGDGYADIPDLTTPVHIDKGDHDMGEVEFKPVTGGESGSTGGLKPAANGGFTGTYSPDGGLDIEIPTSSLPEGVTPKEPVYKKLKEGGDKDNPADWEVVEEIDGAGEYTVEIDFESDPDNYNPVEPIKTTVTVEKVVHDMSEVEFEPTADDETDGLIPDANGGFTGTYSPDGDFTVNIPTGSLPKGVTAKKPVYKKLKEGGNPELESDWENVDKPQDAGTYKVIVEFDGGDAGNYEPVAPYVTTIEVGKGTVEVPEDTIKDDEVISNGQPHKVEVKDLPEGVAKVIYEYDGQKQETPFEFTEPGDYKVKTYFVLEDETNYNAIEPIEITFTVSDAAIVSITVTPEEGATFDIENTLDDVKAKLKVVANLNNGLTEDISLDDISLVNENLRGEYKKLELGEQHIQVIYKNGDAEYTQTFVIDVAKHKLDLPVYIGTYAYTSNAITPKIKDFDGFDRNLMEFVEDKVQSGTNAGVYRVVFALKDDATTYYEWVGGNGGSITPVRVKAVAPYAVAMEGEAEILPELSANEVAVNWYIAKAKITASWKSGEAPKFQSESYKGSFDSIIGLTYFVDEATQTEIEAGALQAGSGYWVVANLLDDANFELEESAETIMDTPLSYTHPKSALAAFIGKYWLWLVIAAAVLLAVLIIAIAAHAAHKRKLKKAAIAEQERIKAEKLAEEERLRAERREAEERRLEREERLARAAQPQYMPQMPMPQYMSQPMGGAGGGASSPELMSLLIRMSDRIDKLESDMSATALANAREELAKERNERLYERLRNELKGGTQNGVTMESIKQIVDNAVKVAIAKNFASGTMNKTEEVLKAKPVQTVTAQPVTAAYPPDAVTTTVTTTRVDTTKKSEPVRDNGKENFDDDRLFDVGGFYTLADDHDLASIERGAGDRTNRNNRNNRNGRNRNGN